VIALANNSTTRVKNRNKEERVQPDNVSNEELWKKLQYIQEQIEKNKELSKENAKTLDKIEKEIQPKGGIQPDNKGLNIFEEEDGSKSLTDVGSDIFKALRKQDFLTRNDLEDILVEYNMTRSKPTHLKYLKDIAGELNSYFEDSTENGRVEFKSGTQGGRNGGKPSRVMLHLE
jgi:hypothetical protein